MKYHFTPVRMALIKESTNNKYWRGCGEKRTLVYCWWECKLVQPLWKTVWEFLEKPKIELPYEPAIHSWIYTQKDRKQGLRNICTARFTIPIFTRVKS